LQNQINLINASIGEPSAYITVDPNSVYIEAYYNIPVSKKINIFSNKKVYVYASKTVSGLKFNGIDVSVQNARTTFCYIEGSALGSMITLKVDGAKQSNNVSLYFTDNNVWGSENVSVCLPVTIATTPQIIQTTSSTTYVNMTTVI